MAYLLECGRSRYTKLTKCIEVGSEPLHGSKGNSNTQISKLKETGLREFFDDIKEQAAPISTRVVRLETGIELRDNTDLIELPPYVSRRSLYRRYCEDRGWKQSTSSNGAISRSASGDTTEVVSWGTFYWYWKTNYPKLTICCPSKDVCDQCHIFHYQFVRCYIRVEQN